MTRGTRLVTLATVALIATVVVGMMSLHRFLHQSANIPPAGMSFDIATGTPFATVSKQLAEQGVIDRPDWFRWYARATGQADIIRAGHYMLTHGETPAELLQKFVAGRVQLFAFTIVEGWNFRELMSAMAASEVIESTLVVEDWPALLAAVDAEYAHPEGLFLPETYRFPKDTPDVEILRQAHEQMLQVLDEEWASRKQGLPIGTPYEALILASIIEKETAREDERDTIAGVFTRRLENRMRLQTDPTVIYGIGPRFNGNITRRDLQTDTPYNTYTRLGLPPTPIAMPGRAAIHAALNPAPGNELFFVATGLGDGSHKFSATKEEHDAAVQEYLARLRRQRRAEDAK